MRTLRLIAMASVFGLLLSALAPAGSAQFGDVLKKAQKVKKAVDIYTPWTPEQEQAIGQASAAKLINIFGLYENPEMTNYVNLVGNTVARQSGRQVSYHFAILNTDVVTALSLPGGYIFITKGALRVMHNESELAGTLAHEIAHIDKRHLEKEVRTKKTGEFAKEEAAAKVPQGAVLINMAGDIVKNALTLQVSRDKENEADKLGLDMSARSGYDPNGLANFLQVLAQAPVDDTSKRALGLWGSTHPPLKDRIASLTALAASYPSNGQQLAERYGWYVNPVAFSRPGGPAAPGTAVPGSVAGMATALVGAAGAVTGAGPEMDGIVSKGVIVLTGSTLPEGSRVKVRVVH